MRKFFSDLWTDEGVFIDFTTQIINVIQVLVVASPVASAALAALLGGFTIIRRRQVTPEARSLKPPKP